VKAYAATQVLTTDLRVKFGTGLRRTGKELEKNNNRPYYMNVN
jgi:hypothetical protein